MASSVIRNQINAKLAGIKADEKTWCKCAS